MGGSSHLSGQSGYKGGGSAPLSTRSPSAFPTTLDKIHFCSPPKTECRRRPDLWEFMDIPCVITHRLRCTRRTRPAGVPPLRSLHLESPSPSTLCWPRRRTRAAAPPRLGAQINSTQLPRLCRSPGTPAWPSQQPRRHQPPTSTHRPCCTPPPTCSPDILSTAAHPSATSRHVEAPFTHKVKPQFPRCN